MRPDFWTTGLDDEPCDGCGVKPSKHKGHGSYTCKACHEASICPLCKYPFAYGYQDGKHICPTPEEMLRHEVEAREIFKKLGIPWEEDEDG